ncbi:MAG: hypothetical protein ACFFCW_02185 [Candidatus Hodarchaeota archaeon]
MPQDAKHLLDKDLPSIRNGAYKPTYKQNRNFTTNVAQKLYSDLAGIVDVGLEHSRFIFKLSAGGEVCTDGEIGVAGLLKRGIISLQTSDRQTVNHTCGWLNGSSEKYLEIFSIICMPLVRIMAECERFE